MTAAKEGARQAFDEADDDVTYCASLASDDFPTNIVHFLLGIEGGIGMPAIFRDLQGITTGAEGTMVAVSPIVLLVRDIFGNPFRPVSVDPAWLRWNDGTAVAIARRVYDERRFEDLPILADALEEAGCTSGDILEHCRGPGPHVRGCWVVDLLLGKG
jgi:hypothetical protein